MIQIKSQKGISMVEVITASVITTLTIALVFGTMMVSRKPMATADKEMRAGMIARKAMALLRDEVDASTWESGAFQEPLDPGDAVEPIAPEVYYSEIQDGIEYKVYKIVTTDEWGGKTVSLEVKWDDAQ